MQVGQYSALVNNGPATISFDLYTGVGISDPTDWMSFTMAQQGNNYVTSAPFGFLVKNNGGVQLFDHGNNFLTENSGFSTPSAWSVILSDTAGTGSAFAGNGTHITLYNGATSRWFKYHCPNYISRCFIGLSGHPLCVQAASSLQVNTTISALHGS